MATDLLERMQAQAQHFANEGSGSTPDTSQPPIKFNLGSGSGLPSVDQAMKDVASAWNDIKNAPSDFMNGVTNTGNKIMGYLDSITPAVNSSISDIGTAAAAQTDATLTTGFSGAADTSLTGAAIDTGLSDAAASSAATDAVAGAAADTEGTSIVSSLIALI